MSSTPKTINLIIPGASKTRIIVGEDENGQPKAIYLNLDDQGIFKRLEKAYAQLKDYEKEFENMEALEKGLGDLGDENNAKYLEEKDRIDKAAKSVINGVFDYNVVDACSAGGTLFDIIHEVGLPRYEVILSNLISLYDSALSEAQKNIDAQREKHTAKYSKKKK